MIVPGIVFPRSPSGAAWRTVNDSSSLLTANNPGWVGYNMRSRFAPAVLAFPGSKVRLTLRPPTTGANLVVASMYIGHWNGSGDTYDFESTPVQVQVGGSNGFTLTAGAGDVLSDEVTFALDNTKYFTVSFGLTSGDARQGTGGTNYQTYYKSAATADAGVADVTGFSTTADKVTIVSKIEAYG